MMKAQFYGGALILEMAGNYCEIPWEDVLLRRNLDLITEKCEKRRQSGQL